MNERKHETPQCEARPRKPYQQPKLSEYGDAAQLTQFGPQTP